VHLNFSYPDARQLNRWLPLIKWLLAIPHYIVLFFLGIAAVVVVIIAWFAILFTGTYPRSLFNFVVGVLRWTNRVTGYAFILVTDQYPPFRLS
jgi:asparagine N-glycosylation enzyme membrane subunit Stt3